MSIQRLHHVSLITSDTARAVGFYSGVLGIPEAERPPLGFPGAWLDIGGQQIHLLELPNPDPTEARPEHGGRDRHVAFLIDDFDGMTQRLEEAGIAFTRSRSGRQALFCRDPDGNGVELIGS